MREVKTEIKTYILRQLGKDYIVFSGSQKVKKAYYVCECGRVFSARVSSVNTMRTKSCGCLRLKSISKHSMYNTKEYRAWRDIKNRCFSGSNKQYKDYGGRGISICQRWMNFENFYNDMGDCPNGFSIDRINNDGDYCKENCRWTNRIQQARNQRSNRLIEINGRTECLQFWIEDLGVPLSTFYSRIYSGKTDLEALGFK
jgi:hypothetical protein